MELKGEVSASLNFLESAILFQEVIREYAGKYHSVEGIFFFPPVNSTEYRRYMANHCLFFFPLKTLILHQG